jgi:hypothetical protein
MTTQGKTMMMQYLFTPLEQHSDLGFGMTASSYADSGKELLKHVKTSEYLDQLPVCFLLRHSSELYLKSAILILHKGLGKPFKIENPPHIEIHGKAKNIYDIHSLLDLFQYFKKTITDNNDFFNAHKDNQKTDWLASPKGLEDAIKRIEQIDRQSSYFRYPVTKGNMVDVEKSSVEKISLEELESKFISKEKDPAFVFILQDENGNPQEIFNRKSTSTNETIINDLLTISEDLAGASIGLRAELLVNGV